MNNLYAHLRSLRYYDKFIIKGKRLEITEKGNPCKYSGHESLLGFLTTYVDDNRILESCYRWDNLSEKQLLHVLKCKSCMAKVFSIPAPELRSKTTQIVRAHL